MSDDLDRLLPAIVAGESEAYASWLAGAEPRVRASLRRFAEAVDTEAVLQEALLRTWQVAPRLRPDGKPNALLRLSVRIARNLAVSELRRMRLRPTLLAQVDEAPEVAVEPVRPDPLLRRVIVMCREKLPAKPALALSARLEAGDQSDHRLAEGLGMKLNTFLQNFTRARRLLAECLRRNGVELEVPR